MEDRIGMADSKDVEEQEQELARKKVKEALKEGDDKFLMTIDGYVSVEGIQGSFKLDHSDGNGNERYWHVRRQKMKKGGKLIRTTVTTAKVTHKGYKYLEQK